jgi:hypothetical protein
LCSAFDYDQKLNETSVMNFTIINRNDSVYDEKKSNSSDDQDQKKTVVKFKETPAVKLITDEKTTKQPGCFCFRLFSKK